MERPAPDLERLHELCRLRSTLEAFAAARLRGGPAGAAFLAGLPARLREMRRHAQRGDYPGFHRCDMALHRALAASCGLPALLEAWERVAGELEEWIQRVKRDYWPGLMTLHREHLILAEAWSSGERWIAEAATHHHLEAGWFRVASAQGRAPAAGDPVDRATSFLSTHYASRVDVAWIAREVAFVSASHLGRLFRRKLGVSPWAFLRRVRLERAAELLRGGDEPVAAVARRCGYRNASHFVRDFRERYGTTPRRFRAGRRRAAAP